MSNLYEQFLTEQGVNYKDVKLNMKDINLEAGLRNQARLTEPLNADKVEQYRGALRKGAKFPNIVVWKPQGSTRYDPLDGNHRLAACAAESVKKIGAYDVEVADDATAYAISWLINDFVNGMPGTPNDRFQHAMEWVTRFKRTAKESAAKYGVDLRRLRDAVTTSDLRAVVMEGGVRINDSLTDEKLNRLAPLKRQGTDLFVEAAKLVSETGINTAQCADLVKMVQAAESFKKMDVISNFAASEEVAVARERSERGCVAVSRRLPGDRVASMINSLYRITGANNIPALRPSGKDKCREVGREYRQVRAVLDRVYRLREEREVE
jgi:hypothetical protein